MPMRVGVLAREIVLLVVVEDYGFFPFKNVLTFDEQEFFLSFYGKTIFRQC